MDSCEKGAVSPTDTEKVDQKPEQDSTGRWGSCPKRVWGVVPQKYRNELEQLLKLAGPVVSPDRVFFIPRTSVLFLFFLSLLSGSFVSEME